MKYHLKNTFYILLVGQAHGFTTLFVLFKWDLQAAMKDYPEDQHLLSRQVLPAAADGAIWRLKADADGAL